MIFYFLNNELQSCSNNNNQAQTKRFFLNFSKKKKNLFEYLKVESEFLITPIYIEPQSPVPK